jgi:uncharacterized protein YebE (UPF0316 family)
MDFNPWLMIFIIFMINVVYVSTATIRMILTLKGYRYLAAFISMFETVIYIVGLGLVLDNLDQIQNLIAYALGYGSGVIAGSKIEEKMALGYIMVNVTTMSENDYLSNILREKGYGVTHWEAKGRDGGRQTMQILTPRKMELKLYETIKEIDPKAFMMSYEPKNIHGGFWVKSMRKGKLSK